MSDLSARQAHLRLERLSPDIKASYEQARLHANETIKYALVCGRKLNEAKDLVRHGQFGRFMVETLEIHPSTANRYMRLANEWPRIEQEIGADEAAMLTLTEGLSKATRNSQKGGNSSDVRDIPPFGEITGEIPTEEMACANIAEIGDDLQAVKTPGKADRRRESEDAGGGADRTGVRESGDAGVEDIDEAIRPIQELAAYYNERCPNERLVQEIERALDIIFGSLDSWRRSL